MWNAVSTALHQVLGAAGLLSLRGAKVATCFVQRRSRAIDCQSLSTFSSVCGRHPSSWSPPSDAIKLPAIWCAPTRHRHHIPNEDVQVDHDLVYPVQSVHVVYVDGALMMMTHISHVLSSCYSVLRQIRFRSIMPSHELNTYCYH